MNLTKETFLKDYENKLITMFHTSILEASNLNKYLALGNLIRDYLSHDWHKTDVERMQSKEKQVYYFSMEFLIGRLLDATLINMGIKDVVTEALTDIGVDFHDLEDQEPDAGLGNGGLGRLAACFIDSMASIGLAGHGMGIRYRYGLFRQQIVNGYQIESPDNWLKVPNVWEVRRDDEACMVKFGGNCNLSWDETGKLFVNLTDYEPILAVPYDMPVPGFDNTTVNTLRLWSAETDGPGFDFASFSQGDYEKATLGQTSANAISNVLYPDDSTERGRLLRLKQEYFFTSAGIQSIVRKVKRMGIPMREFDQHVAIHINDTHPALAVPELMRILIDEERLEWDEAWEITVRTLGYTNHTILAEALEKWPVGMFKKLLPRIYMIVEEINRRFVQSVAKRYNNDWGHMSAMSIISDGVVKMAYLAIVGSHSVNGVAELHTDILKNQELKDFNDFYPDKFNNKTNGITHRRWLIEANPELTSLINDTIGTAWQKEPLRMAELKPYVNDSAFVSRVAEVKQHNKDRLTKYIADNYSIAVNPESIFDIQVKRLHMYKRQLLNIFGVMDLYNRIIDNPSLDIHPHTYIFSAKAFPGYGLAKNTIKLICTVADKINNDPRLEGKLNVVFMPNYGVSLAEIMIPAGNISEQISTASKEASGTGNMKFMMNGAVTLATLDGANVEIHREVGDDNIFLFGMHADEVINTYKAGNYSAKAYIDADYRLSRIIKQIQEGYFGLADKDEFKPVLEHLIDANDPYFVLKDFNDYVRAQGDVDKVYRDTQKFNKMAAMNIACSGVFSSDNTIRRYDQDIWHTIK